MGQTVEKRSYADHSFTPEDVEAWLAAMRARGLARSAAAAARLMNIQPVAFGRLRRRGADTRTALAAMALLTGLGPYSAATIVQPPAPKKARK